MVLYIMAQNKLILIVFIIIIFFFAKKKRKIVNGSIIMAQNKLILIVFIIIIIKSSHRPVISFRKYIKINFIFGT